MIKKLLLTIYLHVKYFFRLFLPNYIIAYIPSYTIRHLYYKLIVGVIIGKGSSIHMGAFFYDGNLHIGENSCINRKCHLDCRAQICIGNNVSISPECVLITGSHDHNSVGFDFVSGKITIHNYAWLGTRAMVLPNVEIGEGAVVCAGAVVTRNVDPYSIVAGVPAKVIGARSKDLNYSNKWFMPFD